jgi:isocitrate dehydrogenase
MDYTIPNSEDPKKKKRKLKAKYSKVLGSAVNPVLREGNSDRRAPKAKTLQSTSSFDGAYSDSKKSKLKNGDFYGSENP